MSQRWHMCTHKIHQSSKLQRNLELIDSLYVWGGQDLHQSSLMLKDRLDTEQSLLILGRFFWIFLYMSLILPNMLL